MNEKNFIRNGVQGLKELRAQNLKQLSDVSDLPDISNTNSLVDKERDKERVKQFLKDPKEVEFYYSPKNSSRITPPPLNSSSTRITPPPLNNSSPSISPPPKISKELGYVRRGIIKREIIKPEEYLDLFLNSDRILTINSVNCGFKIIDNNFYKVQISEVADPLINEVIFSIELTEAMQNNPNNPNNLNNPNIQQNIFPKYKDHFIINPIELLINNDNKEVLENKNFIKIKNYHKVLVTEALSNPKSLFDVIKEAKKKLLNKITNYQLIITNINKLMENYEYYGKQLGFIHSDLHMRNIQIDTYNNYKIIDFGRCFMFNEKDKIEQYKTKRIQNKTNFEKFKINPNNLDFKNSFRLINLIDKNIEKNKTETNLTKNDYICKDYAYLCDIAQVALCLLIDGVMPNKTWFKLIKYNNCNNYYIEINVEELYKTNNFTPLDHGLIWLSSYLIACIKYIYQYVQVNNYGTKEKKNLNYVFGKKILIFNDNNIFQFDLTNTMNKTLLVSNGMFNPFEFKHESIQVGTRRNYETIRVNLEKNQKTGGFNKKLKIKSLKLKHNKMNIKGGVLEEDPFKELENVPKYIEIENVNKNEIIKDFELLNEPLKSDNIEEYFEATEDQIANLGKSIYQIFFEELEQEPEIFNQIYNKLECEPCSLDTQVCEPCHKVELITNNIRPTCPTSSALTAAAAAGGGSQKSYVIHHCKETKRKYIRKSNTRWYLDENRGKYKYLNSDKKNIVLR
jgi:hypothetical protein